MIPYLNIGEKIFGAFLFIAIGLWHIFGSEQAFETIEKIYQKIGISLPRRSSIIMFKMGGWIFIIIGIAILFI